MESLEVSPNYVRGAFRLATLSLVLLLTACSGGGGGDAPHVSGQGESGNLQFRLAMAPEIGTRLQRAETPLDCDAFDIEWIEASVFSPADEVIATGGPWPCQDHQGTIEAVPVGSGIEVEVVAIGPGDSVLFSGMSAPLTVWPNQTTDAGQIVLRPVVNLPPVLAAIGNQSVEAGLPLALFLEASDPNPADRLTFSAGDRPPGAFFDSETGRFEWTPGLEQQGNYTVTFAVADDGDPPLTSAEAVGITVLPGNQPPEMAPLADQTAVPGDLIEFMVVATDPDPEDILTLSAQGLPAPETFDPLTGRFRWEIPESILGGLESEGTVRDITFFVTDDGTPSLSDSETVSIVIGPGNRPPEFTPLGGQQVEEGGDLVFVVSAVDPDGDPLIYTHGELPNGAGFSPETQTFFWSPGFEDAGNYAVEFTATDTGELPLSDRLVVPIAVGDVNRPPRFTPVDPFEARVGTPIDIVLSASDPDGDDLTYTAGSLPEGAAFDPETRRFQWVPAFFSEEPVRISFTVTDDGDPNRSDTLVLEITLRSNNTPPVLEPLSDQFVSAGGEGGGFLAFPVRASDPDGDAVRFSGRGTPFDRGAFLERETATEYFFGWEVSFADVGTYSVTFTVTDNGDPPASDSQTIRIQVTEQ